MDFSQLHFADPLWLWGIVLIPLVWMIAYFFYQKYRSTDQLQEFIDPHLLPYLLLNHSQKGRSIWKPLFLWTFVWMCLTLSLAGPRWSFREIETFSRDQIIVILLDLSESMNATDIKPSRLGRAKQKIEDLINHSKGVKIGFVVFAADPHMMTPVTSDKEVIRHLLPSLQTNLIHVQGSRLSTALEMAATMLEGEPGNNKALLIVSDGGFEDASAITTAKKLAKQGIVIHTMGIGTVEGAPLLDHQGNVLKKNGSMVLSKLDTETLSAISSIGNGYFLQGHYSDQDEEAILKALEKRAEAQMDVSQKNRIWDERFYLFLFPVLPIFLWWFRRGSVFLIIFILALPIFSLEAIVDSNYFKNSEELGAQAYEAGDYNKAVDCFEDSYRKGVACYKAGNFEQAEKMFRESNREEVACSAAYNLGNALVHQQKLKEAVSAYEEVMKKWPTHEKAKENLAIVKKMLEEQRQNSSQSEESDEKNEGDREKNSEENKKNDNQPSNDSNDDQSSDEKESEQKEQDQEEQEENQSETEEPKDSQNENKEAQEAKSQEDHDADLWLNQMKNDQSTFLKNKFYIESQKSGVKQGVNPW